MYASDFDFEPNLKIIYVVRNPKDMIVSAHKFMQTMVQDEFTGSVEDLCELFLQDKLWYGSWFDHVNEYTQLENVHIVHYENLINVNLSSLESKIDKLYRYRPY